MTVSKTAVETARRRKHPAEAGDNTALELGEFRTARYTLKRAQLKIFGDFLSCVAPLQLTPAQFSVLLLLKKNPGRNQTEIASTLGILRPNFVAMLGGLESRGLASASVRGDRRSHILLLTDKAGPCWRGQKACRRQARSAPQRAVGAGQSRRAVVHAGKDRQRVLIARFLDGFEDRPAIAKVARSYPT